MSRKSQHRRKQQSKRFREERKQNLREQKAHGVNVNLRIGKKQRHIPMPESDIQVLADRAASFGEASRERFEKAKREKEVAKWLDQQLAELNHD